MDESEENMSAEDIKMEGKTPTVKVKPKKRSLVERELETTLTARITSPAISGDESRTSRYGRARRLKTNTDFCDTDKAVMKVLKSPQFDKTPVKSPSSPVYKMHASNSPANTDNNLENQIEYIYNANISLSRFGSEEKTSPPVPPGMKKLKVYIRKDLIQTKEKDEEVTLIKNMFSPVKSSRKQSNSHLSNVLERSSEKYNFNGNIGNDSKPQNGYLNTSSVVKALDFDSNKKKKGDSRRESKESKLVMSKNELFEMEAACMYQVGDLAWARMGTYPFWPCIVTREPGSELFVKKKMFGRIERDLIHVTFFGDNGRRSWILDSMLRRFLGLNEFETARDQFPAELKKKDPKLYGAFFISEKKLALWHTSIEEAETLQREPKRFRVDILNDMLGRSKPKFTPKSHKSSKVTRTDSDVSLSESLYDSLFSEDDGKNDDPDRSRNKTRNKSLDVSEVVTACLDNMAAKTGMTKIQRQSHMDRWLQKAKSKTPEKSHVNISVMIERVEKDEKEKVKAKENSISKSKKRKSFPKEVATNKPYSLRRSGQESQNLFSHQNEHDYSKIVTETAPNTDDALSINSVTSNPSNTDMICVIDKVESLSGTYAKQSGKSEEICHDMEVITNGYSSDGTEHVNQATEDCFALENNTNANDESEVRNVFSIEVNLNLDSVSDGKDPSELEEQASVSNMDTDTVYTETESQDTQSEFDSYDTNSLITNNETESQDTTEDLVKMNSDKTTDTKKNYLRKSVTDSDDTNETVLNNVESESQDTQESVLQSEIGSDDIIESVSTNIESASQDTNESLSKDALESEDSVLKKLLTDVQDANNSVSTVYTESQDTDDSVFENDETEPIVSKITTESDTRDITQTVSSKSSEEQSQPITDQETNIVTESDADNNMSIDDFSTDFEMPQDKVELNLCENKEDDMNDSPLITTSTAAIVSETTEGDKILENCNEVVFNKILNNSENIFNSNNDVLLKAIDDLIEDKETTISENVVAQKPDPGRLDFSEETAQLPVTDSEKSEDRILVETDDVVNQIGETLDEILINNKEVTANESDTKLDDNMSQMSDSLSDKIVNGNGQSVKQLDADVVSISSMSSVTSISSEMLPKILTVASLNDKVNGDITDEHLLSIKQQLLLDSDTESMSSQDEIPLCELKRRSQRNTSKPNLCKEDTMDSCTSNTSRRKLSVVLTDCVTQPTQTKLSEAKGATSKLNKEIDITEKSPDTGKTKKHKLRLRKSETPPKPKVNSIPESKDPSPERQVKQEKDLDTISINSSDSGTSIKRKGKQPAYETMKEPEFLEYVELKRDTLMDEHPELTRDEIVAYLYKTWQYKESKKSDIVKTDDIEQTNLVKGINGSHEQQRRRVVSKPKTKKIIDIAKIMNDQSKPHTNIDNVKPRDLPKRKTSKPLYKEEYSDIEEEIEMFEIFKTAKANKVPKSETPKENIKAETVKIKSEESDNKVKLEVPVIEDKPQTKEEIKISDQEEYEEYFDEEELYFEQLTKPKPNIFKGLVREKVCEICEKTSNLVKCKGCSGMFHVECVKKVIEVVEVPPPTRGRKKKKKPRGRRPKNSTDSNGDDSHSDDKSHDPNVSEENVSMEEAKDSEPIVIIDVDNFEAQLTAKMQEMIETANTIEYDSYSSDDGLDWSDTVAGKCKIVDIKLKQKPVPTTVDYSDFKCKNCQQYDVPICFVCKSAVSPKGKVEKRQKCQVAHCHKYFHVECLDHWPQTQFTTSLETARNKKTDEQFEALTCPRHVCHTCVCDDPRGCKTRFSGDKLARCVRCPATYHSFTKCLPAGSQILSASHIVCPRHYEHRPGKVPCHVNTGWCFICALGGTLICCEYCPTSFHADCLNIEPPEGGYMCEDCETGRLPLYGEMVWVKLGHYRWWPGIVLHPSEIPDNIMAVKHTPGEFVVRFFGQYDHYWVNRGRVFPFQEGDSGRISGQKSKINEAFTKAMEHAQRAFEILKNVEPNDEENQDIASSLLPPHYVKLKVNKPCGSLYGKKVDIEESSLTQCECNPDEEEPCGPYSHCLNRMLLTECGPTCRAGERCQNRQFEKRQYPKLVPYRTPHRGWGLKTLEDIRAGQFVIEYVGELIDEEEFRRRMRRKHEIRDENFYFLTLDKERMIDAGPKGNLARFMNHCCEPNCETQKWTVLGDVRVGLFAIYDIPANTEVTFNYNLECAGIEKKACMCGAKRCSGYIGAKPKQDEPQPKKTKLPVKRTYKKRKSTAESPSTSKTKPKRPVGRPCKPRELTEIEKDLLIIKNATNGLSSDSEGSGRLSSMENERKDPKALKRKRVSFSTEEIVIYDGTNSPSVKRAKLDDEKDKVSEVDNIV